MEITLDWLIGFTEGEGCFSFKKYNGFKKPNFSLTQKDALDELGAIRKFLGFGEIYPDFNHHRFVVNKIDDCLELVELFEGKLILKKRVEQFQRWKTICLEQSSRIKKRHWSTKDEERAKEMLKAGASYNEIAASPSHTVGAVETRNYQNWRIYPLGRAERTWKLEDDIQAKEMLEQGISYSNIAEKLGRSYDSIKWRNLHVWKNQLSLKPRRRGSNILVASIDNLT